MNLLVTAIFSVPLIALVIQFVLSQTQLTLLRHACHLVFCIVLVLISISIFISNQNTVIYVANWPAPFGISLVVDNLAKIMLVVFSIVTAIVSIYGVEDAELQNKHQAFYMGYWLLMLSIIGALLTFDIFNLYVWAEVMLLSAVMLLSVNALDNVRNIYQYALFSIVGTLFLLLAIGLLYGLTGSLHYADIGNFFNSQQHALATPILCLFVLGLGLKIGIFPLYFWLPTAYPHTSGSSTMLLASLVTKVMMLILLRLVWLWGLNQPGILATIFIFIACCTMFFGVMGAASQMHMRKILSFHITSQLGYGLLVAFIPSTLAIVACVYFLIHNIFVKTNLLLVANIIEKKYGEVSLDGFPSLVKANPWLAAMFFIAAMSLAGFPPLSGFWAKLLVLKATIDTHHYLSAVVAIVVSTFTLYSMIKLWRYGFCQSKQGLSETTLQLTKIEFSCCGLLLIIPLVLGIYPDLVMPYLEQVADQLSNTASFSQFLLGGNIS